MKPIPSDRIRRAGLLLAVAGAVALAACATGTPALREAQEALIASQEDEKSLRGQKELLEGQLESVILENAKLKVKVGSMEGERESFLEHEALRARDLEEQAQGCRTQLDQCTGGNRDSAAEKDRLTKDLDGLKEKIRVSKEFDRLTAARLEKLSDAIAGNLSKTMKPGKFSAAVVQRRLVVSVPERTMFAGKGVSLSSTGRKVLDVISEVLHGSSWEDIRVVSLAQDQAEKGASRSRSGRPDRTLHRAEAVARFLAKDELLKSPTFSAGTLIRGDLARLGKGGNMLIIFEAESSPNVTTSQASGDGSSPR